MTTFIFNGKTYKTVSAMKSAQRAWLQKNTKSLIEQALSHFPHFRATPAQIERHTVSTVLPKISKGIPFLGSYRETLKEAIVEAACQVADEKRAKSIMRKVRKEQERREWLAKTQDKRTRGQRAAKKAIAHFLR